MATKQQIVNKATEAAAAATAFANTSARRLADTINNATKKNSSRSRSRGKRANGDDDDDNGRRCSAPDGAPFGFLDNVCGPMLAKFGTENDDGDDDLTEANDARRGGGGRGRNSGGRSTNSIDSYDDETYVTDITSYDDDDETYDDDRKKSRGGGGRRGRDRKPRAMSPTESETVFSDDGTKSDADTEFSSVLQKKDKDSKHKPKGKGGVSEKDDGTSATEKLISQPLASGFAKRCYFTKAGIGRTTQHYEGLTLTGNTVLMLASAMKLKGCPTICDEDLRRVEQTYPNQFSRLPDELLLSSGWRRISKYCHFSLKPLPDGVPFFHSRRRCHPNGGFYFLLCSAVGMTRLMDVEPLNKDALAVLQTDFPLTCEKAPDSLIEDPNEWTLVNKFCFFSGGPINVEEDVYYRAELGGTEIYMLAFLSPSLSPEELYRLKPSTGEGKDSSPLQSVAAVEEVESVYDLTERDFDDLKLYHLGPCRALPPFLLHPAAWTKVLPPHFVAARDEAMRKAAKLEGRYPPSQPSGNNGAAVGQKGAISGVDNSGYVELGVNRRSIGPGFPPQYPAPGMHQPIGQDPNAYYPNPGYLPQQQAYSAGGPRDGEMNYYYGNAPTQQSGGLRGSPYQSQTPSPDRMVARGQSQYQQNVMMVNPHWRDVQEEGAFGMSPVIQGDQP